MADDSKIFNTPLVKPSTINGYIESTTYIPPFYTDTIGSGDTRTNKLLVKSTHEGNAVITMHSSPSILDTDADKVWQVTVDKDTKKLSINNQYTLNETTGIETSEPVMLFNSIQNDISTGNGEITLNHPLFEKKGDDTNGAIITLSDSDNEILDAESLRNIGIFQMNPSSTRDVHLDTAGNIFNKTAFPNLDDGHGFEFTIINLSTTSSITLVPGNNTSWAPFATAHTITRNTSGDGTSRTFRIICMSKGEPMAELVSIEDQVFGDNEAY